MKNTPAENWHKIGAPMPMTSKYKSGIMVRKPSFVIVLGGILTITHFCRFPYSFLPKYFVMSLPRNKISRIVTHLL